VGIAVFRKDLSMDINIFLSVFLAIVLAEVIKAAIAEHFRMKMSQEREEMLESLTQHLKEAFEEHGDVEKVEVISHEA